MKPSFILLVAFLLLVTGIVAQTPCSWSLVGGGFQGGVSSGGVASLEGFDDGSGLSLYAGGLFTAAGGVPVSNIARWSGNSWSSVGAGLAFPPIDLAVFDDGLGHKLYAGGYGLAKWDGSSWSPVPPVSSSGSPLIKTLAVGDDGSGPALYAGGVFYPGQGGPSNHIAKWNGTSWSPLGSGVVGNQVKAIVIFDDGSGPAVFVSGWFWGAGGVAANNIAKWNGISWSVLGTGVANTGLSPLPLAVFDDGLGPALYAGSVASIAGGLTTNGIAKWNGSSWLPLGTGLTFASGGSGGVMGLSVFDDGTGPALYVMGFFDFAGGIPVQGMAKWDGGSWSAAGAMPIGGLGLTIFNDGLGPALYAGGSLSSGIGGVARWSCGSSISVSLTQPGGPGPGSPVFLSNTNLTPGHAYYNIFSFDLCPGGAGTGLFGGLCVSSPVNFQFIVDQLYAPLGTSPIHFTALSSYVVSGPFALPPLTVEAITFDFTGGTGGAISQVATIAIQ